MWGEKDKIFGSEYVASLNHKRTGNKITNDGIAGNSSKPEKETERGRGLPNVTFSFPIGRFNAAMKLVFTRYCSKEDFFLVNNRTTCSAFAPNTTTTNPAPFGLAVANLLKNSKQWLPLYLGLLPTLTLEAPSIN